MAEAIATAADLFSTALFQAVSWFHTHTTHFILQQPWYYLHCTEENPRHREVQ